MLSTQLRIWTLSTLLLFLLLLAACGGEDPPPCQEVDCERGVCDTASGHCVSADSCADDLACLEGFFCDDGVCEPDLCDGVTCERGECSRAAGGSCVSKPSCTEATEATEQVDCVDGQWCSGGECVGEAEFCAALGCEEGRGVCDIAQRACVNAEDCAGDDMNCLAGYFCDASGECVVNACDEATQECPRGVCDPADGSCVNPTMCAASSDCLDGHKCLDDACVKSEELCDALGCTGNQHCIYDEATTSGRCEENTTEGCENAFDCLDDRVCVDGACAQPQACAADAYESNDVPAEAVEFQSAQVVGAVRGTICSGDADYYKYNLAWQTRSSGELTAQLAFVEQDAGIGELVVDIIDPSGAVVASATSDGTDTLEVEKAVSITNQREWIVRVRDGGNTETAGVRYSLWIDLVPQEVEDACAQPTELSAPQSIHGTTDIGPSVVMGSTCTAPDNRAGEDVYSFTLTEESYVTAAITPDDDEIMSLALRTSCEIETTEFACELTTLDGLAFGDVLAAGTYYMIVQGEEPGLGGGYTLDFDAQPVVCSFRDDSCVGIEKARLCNETRTGFEEVDCSGGCDFATGRCDPDAESCVSAIDASAGGRFTGSIATCSRDHAFADNFNCVGRRTNGNDAVYRVDASAGDVIHATVDAEFDASLWLTDSCAMPNESCKVGSDVRNPEEIFYAAPTDGTYYVVVSANDYGSRGDFTLDVEVGPPNCTPGEKRCLDADTIEYCDHFGVEWSEYDCPSSCTLGACDTPQGDVCVDAIPAADGDTLVFDPTTRRDMLHSAEFCAGGVTPAPDAFYAVELARHEVLEVTVTPRNAGDDPTVYLAEDCMDPWLTCLGGSDKEGPAGAETIKYRADRAKTVYVVVDGDDPAEATGPWDVSFSVHPPLCTPFTGQCTGADTLEVCDAYGAEWLEQSCYGFGCQGNKCNKPTNDTCATAVQAGQGGTFRHNIWPYQMDYQLPVGALSCTGFQSWGPDAVYAVDVQAGQVISADVTARFESQIWITTDCSDAPGYCVAGDNDFGGGAPAYPTTTERIQHRAETSGTYYVIVTASYVSNSDNQNYGAYTLNLSVDDPICTPGAATCLDPQTLQYCGNFGLRQISYACDGACENGACTEPRGEVCTDAIPADDGDFFVVDMSRYGNTAELHKNMCGGPAQTGMGLSGEGTEVYFEVELAAGEVLSVTASPHSAQDDPMIYVVSDCTDPQHTCRGGSNYNLKGDPETYHYQANGDETVYVIVDSAGPSSGRDDYEITFDKGSHICTPGAQVCDGDTAKTCNEAGTAWQELNCTFGCNLGACVPATNDQCSSAHSISQSGIYHIDMWEVNNRTSQGCTARPGDAEDAFFSFDLKAGEVLDVTVTPLAEADDVMLSLVTDCTFIQEQHCLDGQDNHRSGAAERVIYEATQDETVYLVVESAIQWSGPNVETRGVRELDVQISTPICTPLQTLCADPSTMRWCNESGTAWNEWTCEGVCTNGGCSQPSGEMCADAIDATGGGFFTGRIEDHVSDYPLGEWRTNCVGSSDNGPDVVYAVYALAGDTIRAELDSEFWGAVWITDDCTDARDSCVAGDSSSSNPKIAEYVAPANGTYYVIINAFMEASTGPYELLVETGQQICTPGATACNGAMLETCSPAGIAWRTRECVHGCGGSACVAAPNDQCVDATNATGGGQFVIDPTLTTNAVDLPSSSCLGEATPAPDSFYRIDMLAGEMLEATLTPRYWADDPALYLFTDCADAATSCLNGVDAGLPGEAEMLSYQAAQDDTVYLAVDGDSAAEASRPWDLDLVVGPVICTPEETRCVDATTMEYCGETGLRWHAYPCRGGCSAGACDPPSGERCVDAIPVGGGGTFAPDMTTYANAHHPPVGQCPSSISEGNDVVYAVALAAGQTADMRVIPNRDDNAKVYLLSHCLGDDWANMCLDSATPVDPTTKTVEMSYTAQTAETVYLVVDSSDPSQQSGVWQVDVGIR